MHMRATPLSKVRRNSKILKRLFAGVCFKTTIKGRLDLFEHQTLVIKSRRKSQRILLGILGNQS